MKFIRAFLATSILSLMITVSAFACEITFNPEEIKVDESGTTKVTVVVKWEHRTCELDDDDLTIDLEGIEKISDTGWTNISPGLFHNELTLKLTADTGSLRVWRECSKKGLSEGKITISR